MKIVVGTRASRLSLVQTESVVQELKKIFPNLEVETKTIKTVGDRLTKKPLYLFREKGIFERAVDEAVVRKEVDFAVHSMKDVPTIPPPKTAIVAVPKRGSPSDILVSLENMRLKDMPSQSLVGTSSPRREAQLRHVRPDLEVKPIRGNVDTRVRKLRRGEYDAIILAEIGLQRLKMQEFTSERLSLEEFTPAPGQGALAVVAREDDEKIIEVLKHVNHQPSMAEALAERAFIRKIGGGCKVPIGAIARARGGYLSLHVSAFSPDGKTKLKVPQTGRVELPEELGVKAAQEMLKLGAQRLIQNWRGFYEDW